MTYFMDRSWFVDVNYTMAMTFAYTANYRSTFSNPGATPSDRSYVGDLIGDASVTFTTHTIASSINRAF